MSKIEFPKRSQLAIATGLAISLMLPLTPTSHAAETSAGLEEVLVTARRKAESLQDVPIAVQAFSAEAMEIAGIRSIDEIINRTPGMLLSSSNGLDNEIFIRGIGSDIQGAGAESPVGIFVDGIYMSRSSGSNIGLFDLERVEVLKGPQSLRFGKNIVGGLINYVTKKPTRESEGYIRVTAGDYEQLDVEGAVRGPLTDSVSFSLAAMSNDRSGFARNTLGSDAEDLNRSSVRGQLQFDVNEGLAVLVAADFARNDAGGRWSHIVEAGDSRAVTFNRFFAPPIERLPGFVLPDRNAPFVNSDPRRGPRNYDTAMFAEVYGVSTTIDWQLAEGLDLQSITAYRDADIRTIEDGCGMYWNFPLEPAGLGRIIPDASAAIIESLDTYLGTVPDCWFNTARYDEASQLSQEFRLSGDAGKFQWGTGVYYLREDIDRRQHIAFSFPDFNVITDWAFSEAFGGSPEGISETAGLSLARTASITENFSVFGEVTFSITDTLALNAGVRYARDEKDFRADRSGDSFDEPICPETDAGGIPEGCTAIGAFTAREDASWSEWLPSLALTYQPTDSASYYARAERGYKPGGYSGQNAGNPAKALVSFDAEFADAFELGAKYSLLDRRAVLNLAAHFTRYEDLQTQQFVPAAENRPPDNLVVNASNGTEAYGLEADLEWAVTGNLTMFGNYAYTRCEFSGEIIIDGAGTDLDGNTCRRTPEHGVNIGAESRFDLANGYTISFGGDLQWKDEYFFNNENDAEERVDSEHVLNLRVGLAPVNGDWDFRLWAKNITDERNTSNVFILFGTKYLTYNAPRTYGATFSYNF